jgi:hypothetical protein
VSLGWRKILYSFTVLPKVVASRRRVCSIFSLRFCPSKPNVAKRSAPDKVPVLRKSPSLFLSVTGFLLLQRRDLLAKRTCFFKLRGDIAHNRGNPDHPPSIIDKRNDRKGN